jgi:DNA-directed RNA polymerase specialized sigma subunit
LDEEIAYLKWNLNKTKLELVRWEDGDLAKVRLTNESRGAHVEQAIKKIESDLQFREEMKSSLMVLINTFKGNENQILKKKYVDGKSLECIAEELNYSSGYIRQKHAELRRRLDFLDDWEAVKKKYEM